MKQLAMFVLLLVVARASAQVTKGRATDSLTGKPLAYATIFLGDATKLLYTDSLGYFSFNKTLLGNRDSIYIQYVGYRGLAVAANRLDSVNIFRLRPALDELQPVVVGKCRKTKDYSVNKHPGKIKDYIGPGPETKFVIIGRYLADSRVDGYIKQLEIYAGNFDANIHVPVRLHVYEWDSVNSKPGGEITHAGIIVYPYTQGWNTFTLPEGAIYVSDGGIVVGLEFIYPVEYVQQYDALHTAEEKAAWLSNMNNRWSLGLQTTSDGSQTGFYQVNNFSIRKYNSRGRNLYIKPAVRFTVVKCMD